MLDLAEALSAHADVTVLAPHSPGAPRKQTIGRVAVRRFRYFLPTAYESLTYGSGMRDNIDRNWLAKLQVPFFLVAQVIATIWTMSTIRPAVVNAHWLVPQGLTSALAARILRKPLVLHVHAADVYFLRRVLWGDKIARFVVGRASSVLADGSHVRETLDQLLGFESDATLRPMGVWTDDLRSAVGNSSDITSALPTRYVLFVGRLVEKKGVEYLIRAMPEVHDHHGDVELVIVGSGPLGPGLRSLTSELGMDDKVHFVGTQPHEEIWILLRSSAVVCVPSIIDSRGETEGMPTVVLEAMAAGARVVGSEVDGIPDILKDAENGWLAQPADSDDLARALLDALEHPVGDDIADAGEQTALLHDWHRVAEEYALVLDEAIHD